MFVNVNSRHVGGFDIGGDYSPFMLSPEGDGGGAGGGGEGGGGSGGGQPTFTPPNLNDPAAKQWFEQQTAGLRQNKDSILNEKRTLEQSFKALQDKVKGFGDIDRALEFHQKLQSDEEKKLFADGKFEEVLNRRLQGEQARHKAAIETWEKKHGEAEKRSGELLERIKGLTIDKELMQAAAEAGVHKSAIPDLIRRGREVFSLTEDFKVQAMDEHGVIINGPDGKTPLSAAAYIESLKESAPHFFPGSSGAGSTGGPGMAGPGNEIRVTAEDRRNMKQSEWDALVRRAEKDGRTIRLV